ncbi:MAG: TIGR04139 family peptide modification target [Chryseobacterium jejuense]|uniref:TIGR04139 family peptide modification target n=1 Tax=Chryseobacterium jejuense TaxID=445960 RepID=UPI003D0C7A44
MKKLVGMKRNFSSLENKKINRNDLKLIQGAGDYSYIATDGGAQCYDKQTWKNGQLLNTLYVGNC